MSIFILKRLLTHGYFPRELPPTFSTVMYGRKIIRDWANLPKEFASGKKYSSALRHNLARSGLLRRQLGVPNPISYTGLCTEIAKSWRILEAKIRRSTYSLSHPIFHRGEARAFLPRIPNQTDLIPFRARLRAGSRVIVNTDIARFYHSIYTHSIPWALHGKLTSKQNRSNTLIGNRIDQALRNCHDRQTIGIAIGPDTSLIIAELVLSQIDDLLNNHNPSLKAIRYVDDYELAFDSHHQAEDAFGILQELLSEFELELNPRKTEIMILPVPHEYRWVSQIRSLPLRSGFRTQSNDLVNLFDRAFDFAKETPGEPILRYLMGRLKGFAAQRNAALLYQHLLLQCITVEPGTILTAMGHIIEQSRNSIIDGPHIEEALNNFIVFHCPLGHHNEVCWAIWGIMVLNLKIHNTSKKVLERLRDPIGILLALHADRKGCFTGSVDKSGWQKLMTSESLYGEHWLLAYEALVRGWLPSASGKDYISADPCFKHIRDLRVRFYRTIGVTKAKPSGIPPSLGMAPTFYA